MRPHSSILAWKIPQAEESGGLQSMGLYRVGHDRADTHIPLLGIYPEKTTIQKDTFTPMFIAALFTTARTWKQ